MAVVYLARDLSGNFLQSHFPFWSCSFVPRGATGTDR